MQNKQVTVEEFVKEEATKELGLLRNSLLNINTPILEYLLELLSRIGHNFYYLDLEMQINDDVPDLHNFPDIMDAVGNVYSLLLGHSPIVRSAYRDGDILPCEPSGTIIEAQVCITREMLDAELVHVHAVMQGESKNDAILEEQAVSNSTTEQIGNNTIAYDVELGMTNLNINDHSDF